MIENKTIDEIASVALVSDPIDLDNKIKVTVANTGGQRHRLRPAKISLSKPFLIGHGQNGNQRNRSTQGG
jgi:hypothetical protein